MQHSDVEVVVPGDRLATEEEFRAGRNTYVEEGVIYAASAGLKESKSGEVGVAPITREVKTIERNMYVIGTVTDDVKSVLFVKLDNIDTARGEYLALKDGKIILPKPRPSFGRHDERRPPERKQDRPCGVGDTIVAKVQYDDKDSYALDLSDPQAGVIHALCELCGSEVNHDKSTGALSCNACGHKMRKKVSLLYNRPEEIKALLSK